MLSLSIRVLLIEDDPIHARMVMAACGIEPHGPVWAQPRIHVTHVSTLAGAERILHECAFDVLLLDLGLPDASGLQGFHRLRSVNRVVPIVVLTAKESDEVCLAALRSGAASYLVKQRTAGPELRDTIGRIWQRELARAEAQGTGGSHRLLLRRIKELEQENHRLRTLLAAGLADLMPAEPSDESLFGDVVLTSSMSRHLDCLPHG